MRHGQDASGDRTVRGGVPPEAESALHDGSEPGERVGGGRPASRMRRVLARWMRYDVIALDEVGYVPWLKSVQSSCSK